MSKRPRRNHSPANATFALNIACGGQAGSPLAAEYSGSGRAAIGRQSTSSASLSSDEAARFMPCKTKPLLTYRTLRHRCPPARQSP